MTRVLVVEDSATQAAKARLVLEDTGYQVTVAANGEVAWGLVQENEYDVVVSDVNMPRMGGFEFCRLVKADPRLRALPVVLLTAQEDLAALARGLEAGADDYISKPWTPTILRGRLAAVLGENRFFGPERRQPGSHERMISLLVGRTTELEEAYQGLARTEQELREKNAELERAGRFKSQFLASMSHELRTPLNSILGFSELLLDPTRSYTEEKRTSYLAFIRRSGQDLLELINDVLDLSKIEAGRVTLEPQVLVLAEVLAQVATSIESLAAAKSIRIDVRAPKDIKFRADPRHVRQILVNLLGNALKFTPEGGRVRLAALRSSQEVVISISDNGPGITAADQERVFQAFEQAGPEGGNVTGTGLGLALTRRLVELNDGRVSLSSVPGKGSIFRAAFPALEGVSRGATRIDRPDGTPDNTSFSATDVSVTTW